MTDCKLFDYITSAMKLITNRSSIREECADLNIGDVIILISNTNLSSYTQE